MMGRRGTRYGHRNRRGFYIYGPDFFFVPNRYWEIIDESDSSVALRVRDSPQEVSIPRQFLHPSLREPSASAYELRPQARHYAFVPPAERLDALPSGVADYVRECSRLHEEEIPAKRFWDGPTGRWYAFVWKGTREPFGPIVIPEKFHPYQRGVSAHYLKENEPGGNQVFAPVSFYTRDTGDARYNQLIVLWLNSTLALSLRFEVRSWLGAASERMSGAQLDAKLLVPGRASLSKEDLGRASRFLSSAPKRLPDYTEQYGAAYSGSWRESVDKFSLDLCGVPPSKYDSILEGSTRTVLNWVRSARGDPSWTPT